MLKRFFGISLISAFLIVNLIGCSGGGTPLATTPAEEPSASNSSSPASNNTGMYGKYLAASDVEEVTGMKELKVKEENITLKFDNSEGTTILEVRFDNASFYEQEVTKNQEYYTPIPEIGDKAAICIPAMPYRITFLKGDHCIMVQTIPKDGILPVDEEQLIAISKIVASRL